MVYIGEGSMCVLEQCVFACLRLEHSMMCKLVQVGYSVFEIFYECPDFLPTCSLIIEKNMKVSNHSCRFVYFSFL